ncbi:MAG: response regulator transcription factor [Acidimicrobiales bacterium]
MPRIWVIEDDPSIGPSLLRALEAEGYACDLAISAAGARGLSTAPELVLLDLGLPDADGIDLGHELQGRHPGVRIIMLTARSEEIDIVLGLDSGAVDYITKPFRLAELMARIRAQLRFSSSAGNVIDLGALQIDQSARRVRLGGDEVELRPKEFDLLARLAVDAGSVVRREVLMAEVWDEHWFGDTKTLDVHMSSLRRRLRERPGDSSRITTVRGVGYRLELPG